MAPMAAANNFRSMSHSSQQMCGGSVLFDLQECSKIEFKIHMNKRIGLEVIHTLSNEEERVEMFPRLSPSQKGVAITVRRH
jgi:hypothetical protein